MQTFKGAGCETCNSTGYKGRVGLYEVMDVDRRDQGTDPGRRLSGLELQRKAIEEGMSDAPPERPCARSRTGVTTIEEVLRETVLN